MQSEHHLKHSIDDTYDYMHSNMTGGGAVRGAGQKLNKNESVLAPATVA